MGKDKKYTLFSITDIMLSITSAIIGAITIFNVMSGEGDGFFPYFIILLKFYISFEIAIHIIMIILSRITRICEFSEDRADMYSKYRLIYIISFAIIMGIGVWKQYHGSIGSFIGMYLLTAFLYLSVPLFVFFSKYLSGGSIGADVKQKSKEDSKFGFDFSTTYIKDEFGNVRGKANSITYKDEYGEIKSTEYKDEFGHVTGKSDTYKF